ncbi:hypothetical protein HPP92_014146 [Vanilla planifolia]|uniref:Deoxyhypusine synthase n=1 Tax=Vanilla planifolia TaxID=51239 RepID=A0A835UVY1_VANPL|nr:hypothetical protein HPP92_014146 [Vanilla planifolia]
MGAAGGDGQREAIKSLVFKESAALESLKIAGYDFDRGLDLTGLLDCMLSTGFQATNLGEAIDVVNQMINWRLADEEPSEGCIEEERDPAFRESMRCKIFLGFTSNLISSGVRETIRFLVQHRMVDVLVTTAGGIEEDLIKCLAPTYKGDFALAGTYLRAKGWNRIGNLLVPNENYCKFGDWVMPILDQMLKEQTTERAHWTPSKLIDRFGKEINDASSYLYWASKNTIPVFCPAITDGSIGDMLYLHSLRNPGLVVDIVQDVRAMDEEAVHASPRRTGVIILGEAVSRSTTSATPTCSAAAQTTPCS